MVGYTVNQRGRYKCSYCDHSTYKTVGGILQHLNTNHELKYQLALKDEQIEYYKNKKPKIVEKERVIYRDPPEKKTEYWYPKNAAGIYCPTCKVVNTGAGIPVGQTIENTPHSPCNNRGLMLVLEVR